MIWWWWLIFCPYCWPKISGLWAAFQWLKIWIGGGWASRPSINRESSVSENHILFSSKNTLASKPNFFPWCAAMSAFFPFIKWMKEREEDEKVVIGLSFRVSGRCVALIVVKKLLRRISRDRVPPSRMTCRILLQLDQAIGFPGCLI